MTDPVTDRLTIVLVLDHAHVTGGQAKVAFDSARGLKQHGHRPIVFAAASPIDPGLAAAGIEVVCLDQNDLLANPSKLAAAAQGVWNAEAATRLGILLGGLPRGRTVVHVHGWAKALSPSIAVPIRASGLPAVYTMHEYFLLCPNGGFYNYKTGHVCGLDPLSVACWTTNCDSRSYPRKLWRAVRQVVMERVARLPDVFQDIICISGMQLETVGHRLPAGARVHRVSNPIDAADLGPKTVPASGSMLFVGRISPEKGPMVFAEAARLAGIVPVFVGDGPAAPELRARYPEARLLGWKNADEVRGLMRGARALVFPSLWYEGQPLTVLEAKAMGTPVIVSDVCAARDEIIDGVSGLWFRSGDAADLARCLETLRDDATVAGMARAVYDDFWSAPPTLDRHVEAITRIYGRLTGPRAATGQAPAEAA